MLEKTRLVWCIAGLALIVSGCRSNAKRSPDIVADIPMPEVETPPASASPWESLTFVHRPEFQQGTGPIDPGDLPGFTATDSGLRYRVLRQSSGKKPSADDTVTVNYRGWLNSGRVFDSSYERGKPTTFPLGSVVAGWTEGLQLVGEGGMIELWIPSKLGYGERGSPGSIPPHSHLHFIVELIDVE
ncbi:FKBP-type peptidyl-prolyl cis-trans isomerase [Roseiconus lacunae]|uniref:Peptidyl-prolyl cis-trans isomerase n=1 Tax=Roseiconus lacunae TaxID=2605694 RepID=A0ABT7PLX5_9BACT|nr:FKBP-type peptidyl-prolyl cis-trans isomerase [Roseiconus lacunae]MDM4017503.1 FKBP-type peptidyl-prolyl cis-trans isomerase [Roseiconus lacunae]